MSAAPLPQPPLLSAIVVSHDSGERTLSSLRSVLREAAVEGVGVEVLLVDNASGDGLPERVQAELPEVLVLRNARNLGFGAAVNRGFRAARGSRILLLNPDAELLPGSLGPLLRGVDEGAALAAPRLLLPDGRSQESPRRFYDLGTVLARRTPWGRSRAGARAAGAHVLQPAEPTDVDWVTGAAMLLDRAAIPSGGPFDPRYFLYFEDVDLCRRLRAQGLRVQFRPDSTVAHAFGGGSRRQVPWNPLLWNHLASGLRYAARWSAGRWRTRWWRAAASVGAAWSGRVAVLFALSVALSAAPGALEFSVPFALALGASMLGAAVTAGPPGGVIGRRALPGVGMTALRLGLAGLAAVGVSALSARLPSGVSALGGGVWAIFGAVALRLLRGARGLGQRALRRHGIGRRVVLLAGDPDAAGRVAQALAEDPGAGLDPVGFLALGDASGGPAPHLGSWSEALESAEALRVDGVLLAGSPETLSRMAGGVVRLRRAGVPAAFALTGAAELLQSEDGERVAGLPILPLGPGPEAPALARAERAVQRGVAGVALACLALPALPLLLVLRLRFGASPFVGLPRLGRDLLPFRMWRLRSGGGPEGDQGGGRLGRALRRLHLDELPQLYNVLRGRMALVGPRPIDAETAARLQPWERARFRVVPGITGMWQLDRLRRWRLEQMIASDLLYLLRWSPALDLRILVETLLGRRSA